MNNSQSAFRSTDRSQIPHRLGLRSGLFIALLALVCSSVNALELGKLNPAKRPVPAFEMPGFEAVPTEVAQADTSTVLENPESNVWTPESIKGKTVIINFWASWCAPCRAEMPSLNRAWAKVKDKGVMMLAINMGDSESDIERFLTEIPVDFPIVMSKKASDLASWGVRGLPTTLVIDPKGRIVYELVGPAEWDDDELLDPVLALSADQ